MKKENQKTRALDPQQTLRLQMAKLKLRYSHLTDHDVSFDYGKKEVMMTALQAKLGKTREELNIILQQILL
ncbi:MAG TPA: hypothetical protein VGD65_13825 [Chryseosolibacter sp.]